MVISVHLLRGAAVLACAGALTACASTDYHYSQLTGTRYHRVPIDTYPVSILRIDGQDTLRGRLGLVRETGKEGYKPSYALADPGLHQVTVQGPPGAASSFGETRTIALEIAPCTRYYLVAVKSNPLASDFSVRVEHQEPVSGCTLPRSS
ncbi:MAG: hypothetical protein ABI699_07505 [Caldimonas sp.]